MAIPAVEQGHYYQHTLEWMSKGDVSVQKRVDRYIDMSMPPSGFFDRIRKAVLRAIDWISSFCFASRYSDAMDALGNTLEDGEQSVALSRLSMIVRGTLGLEGQAVVDYLLTPLELDNEDLATRREVEGTFDQTGSSKTSVAFFDEMKKVSIPEGMELSALSVKTVFSHRLFVKQFTQLWHEAFPEAQGRADRREWVFIDTISDVGEADSSVVPKGNERCHDTHDEDEPTFTAVIKDGISFVMDPIWSLLGYEIERRDYTSPTDDREADSPVVPEGNEWYYNTHDEDEPTFTAAIGDGILYAMDSICWFLGYEVERRKYTSTTDAFNLISRTYDKAAESIGDRIFAYKQNQRVNNMPTYKFEDDILASLNDVEIPKFSEFGPRVAKLFFKGHFAPKVSRLIIDKFKENGLAIDAKKRKASIAKLRYEALNLFSAIPVEFRPRPTTIENELKKAEKEILSAG